MSEGQVIKTAFGEQVSLLRAARAASWTFQEELDESYEVWRLANEGKIARLEQAKKGDREIEEELRQAIVAHYQSTGNKKPHPKLGVRVSEVPVYDPVAAISFSLATVPELLMLDKKAFESYAKGVRDSVPLFFVGWEEKVTATIAKDLCDG